MLLAYNTNGLAHHDLLDAIALLAEIGYRGIAITLDHGALNPYDERTTAQLAQVADSLQRHQFRSVIETGARFLLDPRQKHEPTLVSSASEGRALRVEFLCRAIDTAAALQADCVSFWSGVVHDGAGDCEAMKRLVAGLAPVLEHAERKGVILAFEPEPGMLIDTMARYGDLLEELAGRRIYAAPLQLTLDIGHLHCLGEGPIEDIIRRWADRLVNVHIEDMRAGIHEHLQFGEGEIEFPPIIAALGEIGYAGVVGVELSRHSHEGPTAARRAYDFLRQLLNGPNL